MTLRGLARIACAVLAAAALLAPATVRAQDAKKTIKIGVVYDLTGPFAGGGSDLQYLGAKIVIDWFNARGGIEGYKVEAVYADAQSKPDVAINEAVRLIEQEKVDMLLGFYSSAECVPAAARIEQFKKFMWITTCIASPVLEGRNLQYVFRPQPFGSQWGLTSTAMVAEYSKAQLGKEPKDLRVAILHEDGPMAPMSPKATSRARRRPGSRWSSMRAIPPRRRICPRSSPN
jgi:ABC-type branched-subunit amino acid transport system substrate-binding protein